MKKNYLFKNIGRMSMAIGLFATALLSSCLKDTSPGTINFGTSPALVGFQYGGFGFQPYVAAIYGTPTDTVDLKVTLSVASITLGKAVTASLVADDAFVSSYNTANGTSYNVLPAADYSVPNGGAVTWAPGTQYAVIHIKFAGQNIDFTQNYAFALKLTNANGAVIASNLNEALVTVVLKSIYAGTYHATGERIHPVLGTLPFDYNAAMSTINKITIEGNALVDVQQPLTLTINPDNSVTFSSTYQPLLPIAGKTNTYDPATKTFSLNMYYNTSAPRLLIETLKYVGP
jgi:hypothetical protein